MFDALAPFNLQAAIFTVAAASLFLFQRDNEYMKTIFLNFLQSRQVSQDDK